MMWWRTHKQKLPANRRNRNSPGSSLSQNERKVLIRNQWNEKMLWRFGWKLVVFTSNLGCHRCSSAFAVKHLQADDKCGGLNRYSPECGTYFHRIQSSWTMVRWRVATTIRDEQVQHTGRYRKQLHSRCIGSKLLHLTKQTSEQVSAFDSCLNACCMNRSSFAKLSIEKWAILGYPQHSFDNLHNSEASIENIDDMNQSNGFKSRNVWHIQGYQTSFIYRDNHAYMRCMECYSAMHLSPFYWESLNELSISNQKSLILRVRIASIFIS